MPCPPAPHCVCSDAEDAAHAIAPLAIVGSTAAAWRALRRLLADAPRIRLVAEAPGYLHVEARTFVLRFVDDLEFELRADERVIAVRSASRVGYWDLGTNRRRLERMRRRLQQQGVLR